MNMNMDNGELLEIEKYHTQLIDGNILANALRFVFLCPGIGEKELINLRVRDVKNPNGEIANGVMLEKGRVPLLKKAKKLIKNHLRYLFDNGFNLARNAFLFPRGNKLGYTNQEQLRRDIKKIVDFLTVKNHSFQREDITIASIRHQAIDEYYAMLGREHYLYLNDELKSV